MNNKCNNISDTFYSRKYPQGYLKETLLSKALTRMNFSYVNRNGLVIRETDALVILLYEQFIHLTQITLRTNTHPFYVDLCLNTYVRFSLYAFAKREASKTSVCQT